MINKLRRSHKPLIFVPLTIGLIAALILSGCSKVELLKKQNNLSRPNKNQNSKTNSPPTIANVTRGDECPNQVLLRMKSAFAGIGVRKLSKLAKKILGIDIHVEKISDTGIYLMCSDVISSPDMIGTLQAQKYSKYIRYVEPNYRIRADALPNDRLFNVLWGLQNNGRLLARCDTDISPLRNIGVSGIDINVVPAWNRFSTGSEAIVVAVLDTGIDVTHPDLDDNLWEADDSFQIGTGGPECPKGSHGFNAFATEKKKICDPRDDDRASSHGTHVSGIIGAEGNNVFGLAGVVWDVRLMGVKVLNNSKEGRVSDVIKGLQFITAAKKKFEPNATWIVNNSYGVVCDTPGPCSPRDLEALMRDARDLLFVASAGDTCDNTDDRPHFPSSFKLDNLISVAAITNTNQLAESFTNYGPKTVHIGAPGEGICSCGIVSNGTPFFYNQGTSMAAPFVSGAAALMLSNCTSLTPIDLKRFLMEQSDPLASINGKSIAGGRLNVFKAIQACHP